MINPNEEYDDLISGIVLDPGELTLDFIENNPDVPIYFLDTDLQIKTGVEPSYYSDDVGFFDFLPGSDSLLQLRRIETHTHTIIYTYNDAGLIDTISQYERTKAGLMLLKVIGFKTNPDTGVRDKVVTNHPTQMPTNHRLNLHLTEK